MKYALAAGALLLIAPALDAQSRTVHRSTTVHRNGNTAVNRTTTVNHTKARHGSVAHPIYHPGTWNRARVHAGAYRYPHGYTYHRWAVGRALPRVYLAPAYYYAGYVALGLAAPPSNYQWVRYGPDLLLVNLAGGNVVDIRYGVFG
jgi:Ni/Co efflux regulator RcnB